MGIFQEGFYGLPRLYFFKIVARTIAVDSVIADSRPILVPIYHFSLNDCRNLDDGSLGNQVEASRIDVRSRTES